MLWFSLLPFLVFTLLLLVAKQSLFRTSLITLLLTFVEVVLLWRPPMVYLVSAVNKGFFLALDILFIIIGALIFLAILESTHILDSLIIHLELISKDIRVQVILLAWFLENFLEGTAGFGTPSTVVAPILISLGLSPLTAVIVSLLGNSSSVAYGAAGTPIRVGFASIDTSGILFHSTLYNAIGLLVPVFILAFVTRQYKNSKSIFLDALPFALWSGFCFSAASILTSLLGPEFPSILGSVMGLLVVLVSNHFGIFTPRLLITHTRPKKSFKLLSLFQSTLPYILLIAGLIIGKILLTNRSILIPLFEYKLNLFNPGFIFVLVSVPTAILTSSLRSLPVIAKNAFTKSLEPFLIIAFMSIMVQLMINSGLNNQSIPSLIDQIAVIFNNALLPFTAPLLGAFGSFITGSATVSNLMFGNFIYDAAQNLRMSTGQVLGLELVGAATGNMIALADILTAGTVVGLRHHERQVIKGVIVPCLVIVLLAGFLGLLTVK